MAFTVNINGKARDLDVDGDTPLLWVLRDVLGMTGTKFGCGMALCGACTVHIDGQAVRSCITLLARGGSFQRSGSSACRFSSARRARALSTSKMPPCGLLDLLDDGLDFRAHGRVPAGYVIGCGAARNAPVSHRTIANPVVVC